MICPECKIQGRKSRVTSHGGSTTAMHCPSHYDEGGAFHHHDMNVVTEDLSCSNGHRWVQRIRPKCPGCAWPDEAKQKKQAAMVIVTSPVMNSGFVLAVQEDGSDILLPGGHVEDGETISLAAKRELKEEVDLHVYEEDLVPVAVGMGVAEPDCEVTVFLARNVFGDEKPMETKTTLVWADWKQLLRVSSFRPYLEKHFPKGISHLKGTVWRR